MKFLLASVAYTIANVIDYVLTISYLKGLNSEANPIARGYMKLFGPVLGLAIYKGALVTLIILGLAIVHSVRKDKWGTHILLTGAAVTTACGLLWLLK